MPTLGNLGLRGLTANDRSQSDKQAIAQQNGSNLMVTPINLNMPSNRQYFQGLSDTNAIMQNTYQDMLQQYKDEYHIDRDRNRVGNPMNIKEIAAKVSPWFKKYGYSSYVDLSDMDWAELAASYQAANATYKDNGATANAMLDNAIKNNVAKNQPWYEQAWYGFAGMGASAAGAVVSLLGSVKGAIDYFDGDYKDNPNLNGWDNFMNSVMDNDWTRYGNDIVQYGTVLPERLKEAKELGISDLQIVESDDQENSLLSSASPWVALQSGGFTLASMFVGAGEAKLASMLFKGLGTATKAIKTGEALTSALTKLQKAENLTNKFIIPGMVGTMEGLSEGLNTKQQVEEEGLQAVQQMHQQKVGAEVNRRLGQYDQVMIKDGADNTRQVVKYKDRKTGKLYDINQIYQQVWDEYSPKYEESLKQVEYAATKAGINNFYVNSLINGMVNSTLKAGLQAPSVRNALSKSKLFGWAQPRPNFTITGSGATTTVTPKFGIGKKAWNLIKEPLGEFGEEYMQSVSDATMRGGAENNIHQFIDNKYKGDGSAAVGDNFSSDWGAAWTAFTGSATDKETIKSGIYGAISSVIGTPSLGHRTRTGRIVDGKVETTYFGRGLNEKGELESNWERLRRITPWRSGLFQAYRDTQIQQHQAEEAAQVLQEWLRDPNNKDKFDGLVGTFNWAKAMGDAGLGSDEFGYRNSALGKTISDAFMLQKLQGTQYYDTYLNQLTEIANLEEGSELAKKYISAMRDNVNTSDEKQSDEDILKTLKSNANKMLSTLDTIQQESDRVDKLLGNVDEDTKQSLIYGQMMLKDWQQRDQKLKEELANVKIENSVEHSSTLSAKQKEILADYNSIAEAKKRPAEIQKSLDSIKEDIKNLTSRKNLTNNEKSILKNKKAKSKSLEKELKRLDAINDIEEGTSEILSEEEIMNLDPISRSIMLRKGKQKTYVATHGGREEYNRRVEELNTRLESLNEQKSKYIKDNGRVKKGHNKQVQKINVEISKAQKELDAVKAEEKPFYSEEQQAVIDNLVNQGTAQDENFLDKIIDAGRIKNSIDTFNAQYQAILSDPDSFNNYVYNARQSAADIASRKKYQAMNNIQDYATFAREMDKMYNESSFREQSLITRAFKDKDNANFERYSQERQMLQDLIEQVSSSDNHKGMSDNDKEMFAHTITYLSDKGIDFNDNQAVVDALSAVDENGVSEFRKYVEEVNSTIPEAEQTAFTSVGEAIQNFNDVMATYNKENAQREANEAPIEVTPTTPEQSAPTASPEPVVQKGATETKTKSIFDIAGSSTPEGGYIAGDGSVISNEDMPTETAQTETEGNQPTNNATSTEERNPIIQAFADNSNEDVAKAAEIALNVAKNQPDKASIVKDDVRQFIESLSTNSFENVEDFVDALISSANTRETSSEDGADPRADLLRQIAAKVKATKVSEQSVAEEKKSKSPLLDRKRQQLDNTNRLLNSNYNMFPNANSSSSFIASINIDNIRQRFPNSPTIKYYEKYNIEEALRDGILDSNPDIFFITDEEFSNVTKQDMESNGYTYNPEVSMPIIAVVESKNGPVVIGDKKYQPISVMSSTNHLGSAGSTHMAPIRNAAQSNTGTQLISINGKAIVTKAYGKPKAYSADINYRGRNNVTDIAINDLSQDERTSLESQDKKQRRRNPAYQKAKRNFLKRLGTKMIGGRKALVFNQPTLNGRFNQIEIFVSPINESTARNSDNTFEDEARDGDIINFNSRTSRAAKALETFVKSFNSDDLVYEEIDGQIVPTEATAVALQTMANNLQKKIDNFINIPIKDGWEYRITPTSEVDGNNRIMDLSLVNPNTSETIPLATFNSGMTEQDIKDFKDDFIRNLILDDSGKVRMTSSNDSFAKWNVLYSDAEKTSESKAAADNISDIYEDGILGAAATTFNYRIQGIAVQNPFKADGTPAFTETANAVNAQPQQPVTTPTIAEGQVKSGNAIVTDTGVVLDGKPSTPTNHARERAANITTQIEDDSKHIKLADDNSGYIDTRTGKKYARVTSVISADERAGERFDPNSPWVVPSTNIGTGFDEFVRDFFAGKLDNITTSPIATQLWNHLQNIGLSVSGSRGMQEFLRTHNLKSVQQAIESPEVQKEMDEIKKRAIADGTFMKAPNGKPTNLTERQWLQVRTKAFKEWFGDWEKEYTPPRQYDLSTWERTGEYVDVLGKDFLGNTYSTSKEILSHPVERKETTKEDPFGFNSIGVSKAIKVGTLVNRANPLNGICQFTAQRVQAFLKDRYGIEAHTNIINAKSPVTGETITHHVVALSIGGKPYIYDMPQTEFISTNENTFNVGNKEYKEAVITKEYSPRLIEITEESLLKNYGDSNNTQISVIKNTAKLSGNIKLSDIEANYIPAYSSDVSKVVDENGEPLVVYHNTPFEFNGIFDMDHKSRIMPWTSEPFGHVGTQETANKIKGTQFALFLNIRNPLETPDFVHETVNSMLSELYKQGIISKEKYSSLRGISNSELRNLMLSLGYDGTKYENKAERGGTSYSFITPNQIKSATDNVGTFSRTNDDITTFTTPQGEVYGFVDKDGNIYLDETKISPEHPIHEYTHLWDRIVQQKNSKLWNRGVELMKQTTLWNEILNSEHYGKAWQQLGINGKKLDNLIASEVHARLTGTEGEALLKKLADKKGQSNIISKLKDWLLDIWKTLGETFGVWNKEDLDNLTLEDFNHLTIRDFAKGYNPVNNTFKDTVSNNAITELSEKYPNATEEALQKFREQLMGLRNNFISNGLTIIPRDVTVTGSLDVLDSNGKIHTVDVAGTLDLLAYDGNGNFFIFDMKTNRSGIDQHKQEKYSRQLSLYKKFLENKYGIQVKSLNLIPIGVEYPAPSGWKNGTADYSVSPEKDNQLMIDGKNYTGANPILQDTIAVNYTEPHIVWEKMTDEERAMFSEVENTVKAETNDEAKPTEAIPSESPTETVDPILGTPFNDSYLGDMFGMDSTELNNFNMDITTRSTPIPEKYQWNNLTQEQREGIEMQGFNETSWSSLEDEEMEHKLKCLGL